MRRRSAACRRFHRGLSLAALLWAAPPALDGATDLGSPVCGEREADRAEPLSVALDVAGDEGPDAIELLYRRDSEEPFLARFREGSDRPYSYVSTDRLIVGLDRDPADWPDPEALARDLSELLELEGGTSLVSVTPLGGDAVMVSLGGFVVAARSDRAERTAAGRAPALALVSQVRRREREIETLASDRAALRYAVPDRLVTLPRLVESEGPPTLGFLDGMLAFLSGEVPNTHWGLFHIGATEAHDEGKLGSPEIEVAVIDSGLFNHRDLKSIKWTAAADVSDPENVILANDQTIPCDVACDDFGHGTKVAGLISSKKFGVAPETTLIPIRVFDGGGCGWATALSLGIDHARKNEADIIAAAWAVPFEEQAVLDAIDRAHEILFVTPTGDDGLDLDQQPLYPAGWSRDNLLVMGGINDEDRWTSNYGSGTVDIPAPAMEILTLKNTGGKGFYPGSSLAVGYAAGAAALYLASHPDADVFQVRDALTTQVRIKGSFPNCCEDCGALDIASALLGQPTEISGTTPTGCPSP